MALIIPTTMPQLIPPQNPYHCEFCIVLDVTRWCWKCWCDGWCEMVLEAQEVNVAGCLRCQTNVGWMKDRCQMDAR